ncbi:hypothetical protein VF21_09020 [Pseudogymnoascus sp. 05NY08]|nr:hypothetical protein VF21_09020 [Pseudogymnoascus sp. 05NY08]
MDGISPSASVESERSAQVCDRCRKRKVKCDGQLPACANCATVSSECQFSTKLRRNTKRRGHVKDKDETIRRLQAEVADLRGQLQARNQLNPTSPRSDLDAFSISRQSQALVPQYGTPSSTGRRRLADDVPQTRRASSSGPVLTHLGRLVCGEGGVEIFAGSSTGVHFILSAQQKYQEAFSMTDSFPEAVFSLQLLYQGESRLGETPENRGRRSYFQRKYGLHQPREYYFSQIERYFELWGQLITSLKYGFPKLINDEDDDNDLPVDSDFENMEITQLPLPLPGEDTKFGPFLFYIKLAKILSTCLKQLYTTTRRRQGVEKIASLTRALQAWESAAPSIDGLATDMDEVLENQGSSRIEHGNPSFILLWLRLLSLAAMIFVHRPALTYETTQPQFSTSLKICVDSASKIISMLHHYRHEYRLLCMSPIGPSIIFQSALLCLYGHWHSINTQPGVENYEFSAVVVTATELLDNIYNSTMMADQRTQSLHLPVARDPPEAPLAQASWTLRYLLSISGSQAVCHVAGNAMPGLAPPDDFVVATSSHTAELHTLNSATLAGQVGISQGPQNVPMFPDLTGYSLGDLSSTGLEDLNEMNHNMYQFLWQIESLDMDFPVT